MCKKSKKKKNRKNNRQVKIFLFILLLQLIHTVAESLVIFKSETGNYIIFLKMISVIVLLLIFALGNKTINQRL
ncbi:hypothetical protein NC99_37010 [Sunxiuqinia dokdonensis]|uniref:Uncharacterized protein n=1 Tax=Sunxiuqinia dokdonensis TaxID=1409788 RepID=A0A0L8V549_9BACT|nr:hypothetical protein NC99_37010 [Sunxiuqinia dokdonensis]